MGLLIDKKIQNDLDTDGIVSVPVLDSSEVEKLRQFFNVMHPDQNAEIFSKFYVCIHSSDFDYKFKIHQELKALLAPKLKEIFTGYKELIYTMQIKGTGHNSELDVHQDWSIVDEQKYKSYTLWIPLVDSTADNGTIYALKGSHKIDTGVRGGSIPNLFSEVREELIEKMVPYNVKAGSALIFDQKVIHYSPHNLSSQPRVSVISVVISDKADVVLYSQNKNNENLINVHEMKDDFYLHFSDWINQNDSNDKVEKTIQTISQDQPIWSKKELENKLQNLLD